ncbi:GIY-YIG nuclease family protein [Photorhabdus temperata]|uniref:Bacteriophage T5 Orf172 DNA-binding domain-containing protein n=1 Tax=Photorhabdus kayaii TaxID=230088 RepID=A0ABX0AWU2_9GAMM|nr:MULTISPECIES: GIY-YIG nuclease family protein [Photorhabdus]MCC8376385.1 GIY-YIG nuclease family protein [Photorhabdus bodei]MCC8421977.1 GIY-YIG nuclease family protein [Photorhabdus thracensis]MCT8349883.1 GIY-YIG nuclease family protein [Photorhabdus temperata]NDL14406.1 hypothetical protein [Photorhabdus kayaii]NDL23944.1 hypothetical protein [Photorhabdus kayaii]
MHLEEMEVHDEVIRHAELPKNFRSKGWIYVLSNSCMPGVYKVGMTTNAPETRARELSSATGVPVPFVVEAAFFSENPGKDEAEIHDFLDRYRVNELREFFKAPLKEVLYAFHEYGLKGRDEKIEEIAIYNHVISTEKLDELNIDSLFEDLGFDTFGNKLAIAERLIRISVELIKSAHRKGLSFYFNDGDLILIEPADQQHLREHCKIEEPKMPKFIEDLING